MLKAQNISGERYETVSNINEVLSFKTLKFFWILPFKYEKN